MKQLHIAFRFMGTTSMEGVDAMNVFYCGSMCLILQYWGDYKVVARISAYCVALLLRVLQYLAANVRVFAPKNIFG